MKNVLIIDNKKVKDILNDFKKDKIFLLILLSTLVGMEDKIIPFITAKFNYNFIDSLKKKDKIHWLNYFGFIFWNTLFFLCLFFFKKKIVITFFLIGLLWEYYITQNAHK